MRDLYIKNGQGFIIVYSLTSRQSFQDVKLIREQILRVKGHDRVPIVLAANKCDVQEPQREVSTEEGCNLANEWSIPYMETSAKNSTIVNSLFTEIVKEMNIKSNSYYGNSRKEKKKSKKISSISTNTTGSNNKTTLSNHSTSSYTSSKNSAAARFKKRKSDSDDCCDCCSSCSCSSFWRYLCCCFLCCCPRNNCCDCTSNNDISYQTKSNKFCSVF